MKKNLIITFITEFFVLGSGILVYKFAANYLGTTGFSEYALSRRTILFVQSILLLGLGVGIPRYVAYADAKADPNKSEIYFIGGLSTILIVFFIFLGLINIFKDTFAFLIFGNSKYEIFIFPLSLMLLGLGIHSICYAFLRGKLQMIQANLLQIINIGLIPLFAFILSNDTKGVLFLTGLGWISFSILFLLILVKKLNFTSININDTKKATKELLFYGIQRIPGDFGMTALLTLPAIFTAHISGVKEAGYVAFGISLLSMAGATFAPIGLIMLPKTSQLIASKDLYHLKYYISRLLKITFILTAIGVVFFEIFADKIIFLYLGENFSNVIPITRIIMIGALAYTVYVSMRSIIDAYYVKAVNTTNIVISLLFFLLLSGIAVLTVKSFMYIVMSFIGTVFVLGGLTLLEVRRILRSCDA